MCTWNVILCTSCDTDVLYSNKIHYTWSNLTDHGHSWVILEARRLATSPDDACRSAETLYGLGS